MTDRVHLDMVAVHFSTRCGAACAFCYYSDPLAERVQPTHLDDIGKILRKLADEDVREILFVGGDPVIHPQFIESLEIAKGLGLRTSVLSNSWSIRPNRAFEHAVSLIDSCEATILGPNSGTHDVLTQSPKSFEILIGNLKKVASCGKTIGICTNATPINLDQIYHIVESIVGEHGIPAHGLMIQRIIPSGAASGDFKFGLNLNDVDVLMRQIDRVVKDFNLPIHFEDPVPWCTVDPVYHKYLARCEWGYTRGSINAAGLLNRCGADDHYRLGSIWDGNVQELWRSHPILESFRSKRYLPHECQTCHLLQRCGGGCPLSCGTMKDHSIDQLYVQRIQKETIGTYNPSAPSGKGFDATSVRYAFNGDLKAIVQLEKSIFGSFSYLFQAASIEKYFDRCPKAFRVATKGDRVLGYSVIYPLNCGGKNDVEHNGRPSILSMDIDGLCERFGVKTEALYVEVIAVSPDAPHSVRISLLRDLLVTIDKYKLPVYTCPISEDGLRIVRRTGFAPLANVKDRTIYVLRSPR